MTTVHKSALLPSPHAYGDRPPCPALLIQKPVPPFLLPKLSTHDESYFRAQQQGQHQQITTTDNRDDVAQC